MKSITITPVDLAPIPYIERCDYKQFLAELVKLHGENYLCRPDGTLLDGVVTTVAAYERHRPTSQARRKAPVPVSLTGNPMIDMQPKRRIPPPVVTVKRSDGRATKHPYKSVKGLVLAALAEGSKTLGEIIAATGLFHAQVKNVLHRYDGKLLERATNKAMNNKWRLLDKQAAAAVAQRELTVRDRIEAHIAQHVPATATELAKVLEQKRDIVYATCHKAKTLVAVGRANGKTVLWGLVNAQTQISEAA